MVGPRRSGKTTVMKLMANRLVCDEQPFVYINLRSAYPIAIPIAREQQQASSPTDIFAKKTMELAGSVPPIHFRLVLSSWYSAFISHIRYFPLTPEEKQKRCGILVTVMENICTDMSKKGVGEASALEHLKSLFGAFAMPYNEPLKPIPVLLVDELDQNMQYCWDTAMMRHNNQTSLAVFSLAKVFKQLRTTGGKRLCPPAAPSAAPSAANAHSSALTL